MSQPVRLYDSKGIPMVLNASGELPVVVSGITLSDVDVTIADNATATNQGAQTAILTTIDTAVDTIATNVATQTTAAAILAKIIAAPATAANQGTEITALGDLKTSVDAVTIKLTADPATQTTLAAILAKIIAAPATAALQSTLNGLAAGWTSDEGSLISLDYYHQKVHEGDLYHVNIVNPVVLGNNDTLSVFITTSSSTDYTHFRSQITATNTVTYQLYEGATKNAAGTSVTPNNKDRNSVNTTTTTIAYNGTVTANGVLLAQKRITVGIEAGTGVFGTEWVFKPSTTYYMLITANAGSNHANVSLEWYQHAEP
jgi:hypothetical protein